MDVNIEDLKACQEGIRRKLDREIEQMQESLEQKINLMRVLDASNDLISKYDRLERELQEEKEKRRLIKVVNVAGDYNDIHDNDCVNQI